MESVHPPATLVALLESRRRDTPARVAFRFPGDGGARELTDEALGRRAAALAAALLERCRPGARALLLYPPGLDYVVALCGCLLAGVVAVPAYPPRPNNSLRRLEDLAADAQAGLALTTAQVARSVGRLVQASPLLAGLEWLPTDVLEGAELPADAERAGPQTLAVIQYTSGSTGSAKGVMLTHASLLHNLEQIRQRFGHDRTSRGVIWLPPYHDMGLIGGILQPLYAGFTCDLMGPASFLARPLSWLETIAGSRATTSGGPNFAYELVLKRSTPEQREALDLSSWSVAFAGAEPVRADTLERFAAAFACAGFRREAFYPCYGLAEATLMVSGGWQLEPTRVLALEPRALEENRVEPAPEARRGRALVGCGTCLDGQLMAIVDPATGTLCGPDRVGEIWVSGPSVAAGYWGRPEETERVFGARLPGSDARFLRTGDLGFVRDGHLFPTGRLKDLIILRGANHYPEDIEASVTASHASLRRAGSAAFGVDAEGEERLVVVQELERGAHPDTPSVLRAIRRNVAWHHGLQPLAAVLVGSNTLPRTSSGKLRRHECRRRFLAGELRPVAEWRERPGEQAVPLPDHVARPPAAAIERWLVDHFAGLLGLPPGEIDVRQPFAYYGLDSAQAVQLARDLEGWLGLELPSTLAWDHPTLEALARHLAAPAGPAARLRPARPVAEPIAVIGLACRLPGAPNADALWELLRSGRHAISEVPLERFDVAALYDPDPAAGGRLSSRWGAFLADTDRFDPYFFGIVPREAVHMDPQQRLLLESAWEALEDAGRAPEGLAGSATGVFVGLSNVDYTTLQLRFRRHLEAIDAYSGTGSAHCIAANRVSYLLDLHGPSVAIDTACSSALVALHLAARSLASRECDLALCAGVNLILGPETTVAFSRARMLAADGRCKPFDARADGFVRGEGCITLVLARLSDAQRDGDRILGVLRGSATNQDGRTNGLTAPNGPAQEAVLRAALADAGLSPADVDFVEAHGTGTALGDPIEIGALSNVMGSVPRAQPCVVASMKANIGHLEPAAGLAGVAKVLLCLRHEALPPQAGLERLNPDLRLGGVLDIPRELRPWPRNGRPRRAGVSAFGFGGTNAHVLLEEPPAPPPAAPPAGRTAWFLPLSAHTPRALGLQAGRFADWLEARLDLSLDDVCATAAALRAGRICRAAGVGTSRADLVSRLRDLAAAPPAAPAGHTPRVAFLFTGQGSQYAGMARGLYAAEPVFRAALDRCAALLEGRLDLPLLPLLEGAHGEAALEATAHAQPLLFAVEYALVELWRAWGVVPGALLGHSVGEYVAACVAGVMSLEDALALVAARGRLMQALPAGGGMLAVQAGAEELAGLLAPLEGRVALAAVNAPGRVVLSGDREALASLRAALHAARVECRELSVSHAFHSPLLEPMLPAFEAEAARVTWHAPQLPLVSNLTGDYLHAAPDASYWRRHARACVRFADGMGRLLADGYDTFVEIGPAPVLSSLGRSHPAAGQASFLPSLRRPEPDLLVALQSAAALYEAGLGLRWEALCGRPGARRVALPELPFERERYWAEEPAGGEDDEPASRAAGHALAARRLRTAAPTFEARLSPGAFAYLREHRLRDEALVPAAAFVEAVLEAAHLATSSETLELENVVFHQALFLAAEGPARLLQTQLLPETDGFEFRLASADAGPESGWTLHATGRVRATAAVAAPEALDPGGLRATCSDSRDLSAFYATLQARGLNYGPAFRGVEELWSGRREALGRVALPAGLEARNARLHPALLDACFQVLAGALPQELLEQATEPYLPAEIGRLTLYGAAPAAGLFVYARLDENAQAGPATISGSLRAADGDGRPVFDVQGFRLRRLGLQTARARAPLAEAVYALTWEPAQREPALAMTEPGSFLVLGDDDAFSAELATRLEAAGQACVCAPWPPADDDDGRSLATLLAAAEQAAPLRGVIGLRLSSARDVSGERVAAATRSAFHVVRGLAARSVARPPRLVLATRGAQAAGSGRATACEQATLVGLARVASVEHPELGCKLVDLDPSGRDGVDELLAEVLAESASGESAWRGGQRLVPSLVPHALAAPSASEGEAARLATPASATYCLDSQAPGSLERLVLRPSVWPDEPPPGCVEIEIDATGLNFSDVLKAMGLYPGVTDSPLPLGAECSGRVLRLGAGVAGLSTGDAVFGVAPFCFGNRSVTDARLLAPIPATLSCEQAAAVPIAFLTAYYALDRLARLRAGESVLIHAAAGGVGLAAVQIARRAGARIFATAGSPEKRDALRALGLEHVFDSRDAAFAERIRERSGGEGVDVVLNSLPGDAIPRSLALLRPYGRFLEIGKIDIYQDRKLGLLPFSRSLSYFAIDLDRMLRDRTDEVHGMLLDLALLLARGELRPLPLTLFELDDAVAAFRYMAQRRNTGKVVLRRSARAVPAAHAPWRGDATYLVTGGLGGIGLRLAEWLVTRGVRHLALVARRPPVAEQEARLEALRRQGVDVRVVLADVSEADELGRALAQLAQDAPPLRGVLHAAGRLDDGALLQFEAARLDALLAPKVAGTWNLHVATRDCPLDLFVLFASAATLLGSPGQAGYAAANAFQDAFASIRHAQGLPVTVVDWGPWAEVGMAARGDNAERLARQGLEPIAPDEAFALLERLIRAGEPGPLAVLPARWGELLARYPSRGVPTVLRRLAAQHQTPATRGSGGLDRRRLLEAPAGERHGLLELQLRGHLSRVAGIPLDRIDVRQPLTALGVDSLTALELKNGLEASLEVSLPMARFMEGPSIERLVALVVAQLSATAEDAATGLQRRTGVLSPPLVRRARGGPAPLSPSQERLLRRHAQGRAAALPLWVRLEGELDVEALERAWAALTRRQHMLRTRLVLAAGEPCQDVDADAGARLSVALEAIPAEECASVLRQRLAQACASPFDVERGPLVRATLARVSAAEHALLVAAHPLVFDAPSRAILVSELARLYEAVRREAEADLGELPVQFGDYAAWQRAWLTPSPPPSASERDGGGPPAGTPTRACLPVPLSRGAGVALERLALEHALDPRVPWLACLLTALQPGRHTTDARLGCTAANRSRVGIESLIGPLANFVTLPADPGGEPTFLQLLERLREGLAGALRDEDRPWELSPSGATRDELPALDTLWASLAFERAADCQGDGVRFVAVPHDPQLDLPDSGPRAALELALWQGDAQAQATLRFATAHMDVAQAEQVARALAATVERAAADPQQRLASLHAALRERDREGGRA